MITGELKNKIDRIWETFWTGGITNPLENLLDDNVCFVVEKESYYGDEIERILEFLQTHYDKDTEYEIIGSTRNLTIVKYKHGS